MIGLDLDGVLLNDIYFTGGTDESKLHLRTNYVKPLFQPNFDYVVITGRPYVDKKDTLYWFNKFFLKDRSPEYIYIRDDSSISAVEFKIKIINSLNLQFYVESSETQLHTIAKNVDTEVLLFKNLISEGFNAFS